MSFHFQCPEINKISARKQPFLNVVKKILGALALHLFKFN
jgi:hypothetical protein